MKRQQPTEQWIQALGKQLLSRMRAAGHGQWTQPKQDDVEELIK